MEEALDLSFDRLLMMMMVMMMMMMMMMNPSGHTVTLGSSQPLTEMSTKDIRGGKVRPVPRAGPPYYLQVPTV